MNLLSNLNDFCGLWIYIIKAGVCLSTFVIPSRLLSLLPDYCHSFRITVILSRLLSFLPYFCHSFRIFVIPSVLVSFLPNIVIPNYLDNYKYWLAPKASHTQKARKMATGGGHICECILKIESKFDKISTFFTFFECWIWAKVDFENPKIINHNFSTKSVLI